MTTRETRTDERQKRDIINVATLAETDKEAVIYQSVFYLSIYLSVEFIGLTYRLHFSKPNNG